MSKKHVCILYILYIYTSLWHYVHISLAVIFSDQVNQHFTTKGGKVGRWHHAPPQIYKPLNKLSINWLGEFQPNEELSQSHSILQAGILVLKIGRLQSSERFGSYFSLTSQTLGCFMFWIFLGPRGPNSQQWNIHRQLGGFNEISRNFI